MSIGEYDKSKEYENALARVGHARLYDDAKDDYHEPVLSGGETKYCQRCGQHMNHDVHRNGQ